MMDEFEMYDEDDVYVDPVEKKTGNRKKTAAYVIGGAALGGVIGDLFSLNEVDVISEIQWDGGEYGDFTNEYIKSFEDQSYLFDLNGDDEINDYIESITRESQLNDSIDNFSYSLEYAYDYSPTAIGTGTGAIGGFGADYFEKRIRNKKTKTVDKTSTN